MPTQGFYVSFSGESAASINNVFALGLPPGGGKAKVYPNILTGVPSQLRELRGMAFGPDGNFYVAQAYKGASAILKFSGAPAKGSPNLNYIGTFAASSGLIHPYQPIFHGGNLFVSCQDTNVVLSIYGPQSSSAGKTTANSSFLQENFPTGTFNPGTFAPAFSADANAPDFTPVPQAQGGLTFAAATRDPEKTAEKTGSTHSVRGVAFDSAGYLYAADEGNDRVAVYDPSGAFVGAITQSKTHAIVAPVALCFAPSATGGTLFIGSPGSASLFTLDVSGTPNGDFTADRLVQHDDLKKASGLALDSNGAIYTGDRRSYMIHTWSAKGDKGPDFAGPFSDSPELILAASTPLVGA